MVDDEPIRQQLKAGEHLLWSGRPRQGIRATFEEQAGTQLFIIAFLVVWLIGVASGALRGAWGVEGHFDRGTLIIGLMFLTVGGAMLALVLGYDAVDRAHRFYGLTGQRIIHITGVLHPTVRSYPLQQLQRIDVDVRDDGSGTITFEDASYSHRGYPVAPSFEKIENVHAVYDVIRKAKQQVHGPDIEG